MLYVFWLYIQHWYRKNGFGMDLDTSHEYMQDAQDIQDQSCIPALELKWKNVQFCVQRKNL